MNTLFTTALAATEEVAHVATQSAGIGAIGLDARSLLFQVINFAILLLLLRAFAYRPILKILQQRRQTIEESLQTAEDIATQKTKLETQGQAMTRAAQAEAQALMVATKQQTRDMITQAEKTAEARAAQITKQAEAKLAQEVATVRTELKRETAALVVLATEKILQEKIDPKKDAALIARALKAHA